MEGGNAGDPWHVHVRQLQRRGDRVRPLPGTSADGQPEGNSAPNVLEYLATPQDHAGAYGGAACTVDVATRSVLLVIRLRLRFSGVLEP